MNDVDFLVYVTHMLTHHISIVFEIVAESGQVSAEGGKICSEGMYLYTVLTKRR